MNKATNKVIQRESQDLSKGVYTLSVKANTKTLQVSESDPRMWRAVVLAVRCVYDFELQPNRGGIDFFVKLSSYDFQSSFFKFIKVMIAHANHTSQDNLPLTESDVKDLTEVLKFGALRFHYKGMTFNFKPNLL